MRGPEECRAALEAALDPLLRGADIRRIKPLLREMEGATAGRPAARAAMDMALHDLWAKYLGLPLAEWLGRVHDRLPTSITIGLKNLVETLEDVEEYRRRGFRILKIKIGGDLDEDIERLHRIRERTGSDILIRVDANQGYTRGDYENFLRSTSGLNLEFVEQPLPASDLEDMRNFSDDIRKMTAADESLLGGSDAVKCLSRPRPFGIFNIKLMKCGGIEPALGIAELARWAGIDLMWGCMDESVVGIAAALHAALAAPATRYLDLDGSLDLAHDPARGGFVLENGEMRLTDEPGLGVRLVA